MPSLLRAAELKDTLFEMFLDKAGVRVDRRGIVRREKCLGQGRAVGHGEFIDIVQNLSQFVVQLAT